MGTAQHQCATDACPLALCDTAFATLMLHKVQHTRGGLRGWREGATIVLSFLATHARKPTDRTKFCHLYWLMRFAAHFVYMVQFDLIRIQSLYQIYMYLMNYVFMLPSILYSLSSLGQDRILWDAMQWTEWVLNLCVPTTRWYNVVA